MVAATWHVEHVPDMGWGGICHLCNGVRISGDQADAVERVRWHTESKHGRRPGSGYVKEPPKPREEAA